MTLFLIIATTNGTRADLRTRWEAETRFEVEARTLSEAYKAIRKIEGYRHAYLRPE